MIGSLPPTLYKYLPSQYAERMRGDGAVRVGTLFEFRNMETDEQRGDQGEGRLRLHSDAGQRVYNSTAELPPILRSMGINCGPGGLATSGEDAVVFDSSGRDMLIYCISEHFDAADMKQWGGACVRITNPGRFFGMLDNALRSDMARKGIHLGPLTVGRCSYVDRNHNWHGQLPATWLLKPRCYQHQAEVRAGWEVDDTTDLRAAIVQSSGIANTCDDAMRQISAT